VDGVVQLADDGGAGALEAADFPGDVGVVEGDRLVGGQHVVHTVGVGDGDAWRYRDALLHGLFWR
jgi:hypothetical protein